MNKKTTAVYHFLALGFFLSSQFSFAKAIVFRVPRDYPTIQDAIRAVPPRSSTKYKIKISPGTYYEAVNIPKNWQKIVLMAHGTSDANQVVISSGRGDGPMTIAGDDIVLRNLTLINTAAYPQRNDKPLEGRALEASGDRLIFDNVHFIGHQDTIYFKTTSTGRSYFKNCEIEGSVDFICGGGTAFFDSTLLHSTERAGVIAAPATDINLRYGFVFWNSLMTRDSVIPDQSSYLMRPWGPYGATAFNNSVMDDHIRDIGWMEWINPDGSHNEYTCRANEFESFHTDGTRVDLDARADWVNRDSRVNEDFSKEAVLGDWTP